MNVAIFWIQVAKVSVALFIITDVLGNLPFFIALTEGASREERRKTTFTAILTGLFLLAFFVTAGKLIFDLFALTMEDIKIAGGLLLFIIALDLLIRTRVSVEHREDVGVVPLGTPLLVGPGAITTVIMMTNLYNIYAILLGVAICFIAIWLVLRFADFFYRLLGKNGSLIVTKISAIIIAAIAIRFIRQGIEVIFHLI